MQITLTLDIDCGGMPVEDAKAYLRDQYGENTLLLVEPDENGKYTQTDVFEAVEVVVLDILRNEFREHDATNGQYSGTSWNISCSWEG